MAIKELQRCAYCRRLKPVASFGGKKHCPGCNSAKKRNCSVYPMSADWDAAKMLGTTRSRARQKAVAFDLDGEWLQARLDAGACELTGIPFSGLACGTRVQPYRPSLHRVDPDGGYTKANVLVVCAAINTAILDYPERVFERIARGFLAMRKNRRRP